MRSPALLCVVLGVTLLGCDAAQESTPRREPSILSREAELRPTDTSSSLQWRYQPTDVVESMGIDGGAFKIHFTRAGVNGVPPADADDSGVPDLVERIAETYEAVGTHYDSTLGFRRSLSDSAIAVNGGDGRLDVYLLDFARSADGAFRVDQRPNNAPECLPGTERCIGYVVQENDFVGYGYPNAVAATRILASHEYFHAVQSAYDNGQNVVVSEGTAVWATEHFDRTTNDFENFIDGYLDLPDRSIDSPPPGPVPAFAYGSAIFFKFLTERHGDAIIRKLWEHLENGRGDVSEPADQADPTWVIQLDALLKREYQSSFAAEFAQFARWNLYMGFAADSTKAWADATRYPPVKMTNVAAPYRVEGSRLFYASTQYFSVPAAGRTVMTAAILDSNLTATNDLDGLVVHIAARKGGRNTEVVRMTAGETVDVTNGTFIAAITNTNRGPRGTSLSQRPNICLGTPAEVAGCVSALSGDGGTSDGGMDGGVDAGTGGGAGGGGGGGAGTGGGMGGGMGGGAGTGGGTPAGGGAATGGGFGTGGGGTQPPVGCGCAGVGGNALFFASALALLLARRRRSTSH